MNAFAILPSWCRPYEDKATRRSATFYGSMIAFLFASTLPAHLSQTSSALVTVPVASILAVILVLKVALSKRRAGVAIFLAFLAAAPLGYATGIVSAIATLNAVNVFGAFSLGLLYGPISGVFLMATFVPMVVHARLLARARPVDAKARVQLAWGTYVALGAAAVIVVLATWVAPTSSIGDPIMERLDVTWLRLPHSAYLLTPVGVFVVALFNAVVGALRMLRLSSFIERVARGEVPRLRVVDTKVNNDLPRATVHVEPRRAIVTQNDDPYRATPEKMLLAV